MTRTLPDGLTTFSWSVLYRFHTGLSKELSHVSLWSLFCESRQQMKRFLTPPLSHDMSSSFDSLTVAKSDDWRFIYFFFSLTRGRNKMSESLLIRKWMFLDYGRICFGEFNRNITFDKSNSNMFQHGLSNNPLNIALSFSLIHRRQTHKEGLSRINPT